MDSDNKQSIIDKLQSPLEYNSSSFNFPTIYKGKNIRVCIIDSGQPMHPDIPTAKLSCCLLDKSDNFMDKHGHSTMVSGLIFANNIKALKGIAPEADSMYCKVIDNNNLIDMQAVIASLLWAIVNRADVIVMPSGVPTDVKILHDTIIKAEKQGIAIIASASNNIEETSYPAEYPEVISFKAFPKGKQPKSNKHINIPIATTGITTAYLNNRYIKSYGSSLATGIGAGLVTLKIEEYRTLNKPYSTRVLYKDISNILLEK